MSTASAYMSHTKVDFLRSPCWRTEIIDKTRNTMNVGNADWGVKLNQFASPNFLKVISFWFHKIEKKNARKEGKKKRKHKQLNQTYLYTINLIQSTLFIPTLDTTTKFVIMTIWMSRNLCSRGDCKWEIMQAYYITTSSNICLGYLLESPHWGDSNKYPKHMFYEEIRIKQNLSYISFCPFRILYNKANS